MKRAVPNRSQVATVEAATLPLFAAALRQRQPLTRVVAPEERPGYISSGLRCVDRAMHGGLPVGAVTLVAARPRAGASSFLLGAALDALKRHRSVAVFSEQMREEQLRGRFVVLESRVNGYRFRAGVISDDDRAALTAARDRIPWASLSMVTRPLITARAIEEHLFTYRPLVAVADLMPRTPEQHPDSRFDDMMAGMENLARLAERHQVAVLVRYTLPRRHHPPALEELPGLGAFAAPAAAVLLVHREEVSNPDGMPDEAAGQAQIHVVRLRGRRIEPRVVELLFDQRFAGLVESP
ncbi:MAG: DnaB-like helicase C-terminal domain-containing protein [Myxococcota bacterium]